MAEYIEREADSFKYYVVRNKETGLYFRGKGVNKWGKYYNQASVYRFKKHAENAVEEETRRGNPTEVVEIRIAEATADVVEVVRCKDCLHFLSDTEHCKEHNKGYCEFDNTIKAKNYFCSSGERRSEN